MSAIRPDLSGTVTQKTKPRGGAQAALSESAFRSATYRPFFRQHLYLDRVLNNSVYQLPRFYRKPDSRNPTILVERGLPAPGRSPAVIAIDTIPDNAMGAGPSGNICQVIPRYTWGTPADSGQATLPVDELHRRDNVSDEALEAFQDRYGQWVSKGQIFSYTYGMLHSPKYRAKYEIDLVKLSPRIPEVASVEDFKAFSEAGQQLLDMHIGYEEVEPYPLEESVSPSAPDGPERYRVQKMRWGGTSRAPDKSTIVCNDWITLAGIPE